MILNALFAINLVAVVILGICVIWLQWLHPDMPDRRVFLEYWRVHVALIASAITIGVLSAMMEHRERQHRRRRRLQ